MMAMADWVATFSSMAGVVPSDPLAAAAGLPPLDSIDMTDYIFGRRADSPRTEIQVDSNVLIMANSTPGTPDKIWKLFSTDWCVLFFRPRSHPPLVRHRRALRPIPCRCRSRIQPTINNPSTCPSRAAC